MGKHEYTHTQDGAVVEDDESIGVSIIGRETKMSRLVARANAASGLAEALEYIANPILAMQKQLKPGERLDGIMAVHLSESNTHLKDVAVKALAAWREVCGG